MRGTFNGACECSTYEAKRAVENYKRDSEIWEEIEKHLYYQFVDTFDDGAFFTQQELADTYLKDRSGVFGSASNVIFDRLNIPKDTYAPFFCGWEQWRSEWLTVKQLVGDGYPTGKDSKVFLTPCQSEWVRIWQKPQLTPLRCEPITPPLTTYSEVIHHPLTLDYILEGEFKNYCYIFTASGTVVATRFVWGLLYLWPKVEISHNFIQRWRMKRRIKKFLKEVG